MLGYPPLDADGRAKVWKNLIELVPPQPIDPATGEVSAKVANNPRKASKYRIDFSEVRRTERDREIDVETTPRGTVYLALAFESDGED